MSKAVFVADARRTNLIVLDTCLIEQHMASLSGGAFKMYVALCYFARITGKPFPKVSTLATQVGASEQSVRNWAKELSSAGLISIDAQFRQNGSQSTNLYTINEISHILTPLPQKNNTPVDPEGNLLTEVLEKKITKTKKPGSATQDEIRDMVDILACLSLANREQYGGTDEIPMSPQMIAMLKPLLRSYGKHKIMAACVGWRKDAWAVERRLSYPQHVFKYIDKYAPLAKKSTQDSRYKKLTDTLGGSFPEDWA